MNTLPDCMMPDGAEPCRGYRELLIRAENAERRVSELEVLIDPPICRLQFPDGSVPGNAREAAEGWHRLYVELLSDATARLNAGTDALRMARLANAGPSTDEPCPDCNGTGLRDSGGIHPWGEAIFVPCDCAAIASE